MERFHSKKILKRIEIFLSQICFKCSIITPEEASEISFQIIGSAKKVNLSSLKDMFCAYLFFIDLIVK